MAKAKIPTEKVNLISEKVRILKKKTTKFTTKAIIANKMTPLEKMEKLKSGVYNSDLEKLKARTGLPYEKLSKALAVTKTTLLNKKRGTQKFNASLSESIIGLEDIYLYGYEVFEDQVKFKQWMFTPNRALGGKSPYDIIDNQFGREEVKNLIGRIDYGVYS